jgi:hypothetical protein
MLHAARTIELPGPHDFVGDPGAPDDHEPRTSAHVRWLILHGNGYERHPSFDLRCDRSPTGFAARCEGRRLIPSMGSDHITSTATMTANAAVSPRTCVIMAPPPARPRHWRSS